MTVSGGAAVAGGYPVGDVTATLRRNTTGTPPPYTLLRATSELNRAVVLEGRVSVALTGRLAIEAGGSYSAPELDVTVSEDPEASSQPSISAGVDQYVVDVSGIYQLPVSLGRRARPYALAGAGYLRQLHEGRLLVETGHTIHVGGGVQYWWRGTNTKRRPLGVRGEARYVRRSGGVEFSDRTRGFPTISVLAFIGL
jgi:hypothetical protein